MDPSASSCPSTPNWRPLWAFSTAMRPVTRQHSEDSVRSCASASWLHSTSAARPSFSSSPRSISSPKARPCSLAPLAFWRWLISSTIASLPATSLDSHFPRSARKPRSWNSPSTRCISRHLSTSHSFQPTLFHMAFSRCIELASWLACSLSAWNASCSTVWKIWFLPAFSIWASSKATFRTSMDRCWTQQDAWSFTSTTAWRTRYALSHSSSLVIIDLAHRRPRLQRGFRVRVRTQHLSQCNNCADRREQQCRDRGVVLPKKPTSIHLRFVFEAQPEVRLRNLLDTCRFEEALDCARVYKLKLDVSIYTS